MKIKGIILAAGGSERMGYPKALLKIGTQNFTDIISEKLKSAGVDDIYLVLGAEAEAIKKKLSHLQMNIVINKFWKQGQLSSLKAALKKMPPKTDAIILCLIDHPHVSVKTISKLIEKFIESRADIVIPLWKNRRGHPVIFSANTFKAIKNALLKDGLRAVIKNTAFSKIIIEVNDPYIKEDIDTKKEYQRSLEEVIENEY